MGICHDGKKCFKEIVLSGPLESDIGKVWNMSEIATQNKVYCINFKFYFIANILCVIDFSCGTQINEY